MERYRCRWREVQMERYRCRWREVQMETVTGG
jgi:hypothetical protein